MKKTISLILTAGILLSASVCSCTGSDDPAAADNQNPSNKDTAAVGTDTETEAAVKAVDDGLPDMDFGGREFRVFVYPSMEFEMLAESADGSVENDSVYERNRRIEERFNISIKASSPDDYEKTFASLILAGEDACDIASFEVWRFANAQSKNLCANWADTPYIQFDQPWWYDAFNTYATVGGQIHGINGALSLSNLKWTSVIYVNSRLAAQYDITQDSLYTMVNDGKWTFDALRTLTANLYQDLNSDGKRDHQDLYGFVIPYSTALDPWPYAAGLHIIGQDSEQHLTVEFDSEKMYTVFDTVFDFLHGTQGAYIRLPFESDDLMFTGGNAVFYQSFLGGAFTTLRDMEDVYSVLPEPKFDESQDGYHNLVLDGLTVWVLPVTAEDTEFISVITDALCADSYYNVYPLYLDVALKGKYSSDEATAEMMDLIVSSSCFDLVFMYGDYLSSLPYLFRETMKAGNNNLASSYEKIRKSVNRGLERIEKLFGAD